MNNKIKKFCLLIAFFALSFLSLFASDFTALKNYGAYLEPEGVILHGAGQSADAFENYWNLFPDSLKPMIYMTYQGLDNISPNWTANLKSELMKYHKMGYFVIPQIGLAMTSDGHPELHYEGKVANGEMDEEIDNLIAGLRNLALPAYLRIGYEFNGVKWNGYQPETYKEAFRRITAKIRESGLEIATVWDMSLDGEQEYMSYYPGDTVVDWWGTNPFSKEHIWNTHNLSFLDSAEVHGKPVLIGESTPRYVGVTDGESDWNDWFVPFYRLIHEKQNLKMLGYINWNWGQFPYWGDWDDARLEANEFVQQKYQDEIDTSIYFHATSELKFRKILNYQINANPDPVEDFHIGTGDSSSYICWCSNIPDSLLAHYVIYANGRLVDYTLDNYYLVTGFQPGETISLEVFVMDRASNLSPSSGIIEMILSTSMEKIKNGDFELGSDDWNLAVWGGQGEFSIDQSGQISGYNSAKIKVAQSPNTNWQIQLRQSMKIYKDAHYNVTYKAKASKPTTMETWLQEAVSPYFGYISQTVSVDTTIQTFTHEVVAQRDDDVYLEFMVGSSGVCTIWIDDVSVVESGHTSSINPTEIILQNFTLHPLYPNPFNATAKIPFSLRKPGNVKLQIFDILGHEVTTLVNDKLSEGNYNFTWIPDSNLASGLFFYNFQYNDIAQTKKCILIK